MDFTAGQTLKPFSAVRPNAMGSDLSARTLKPSIHGEAGRFATEAKSQHEQLTDKTRSWVAQTFFGTMLKQMRESPFKSEIFSGGQGGQAFSQLYDQHLSEHMARGAGSKLVNGIVRHIEASAAYRKQGAQPVAKADNKTDSRRNGSGTGGGNGNGNARNPQRNHGTPASRA